MVTLTGSTVHETTAPIFDYVTNPATEETVTIVVSPPGYEPVMATVTAYGPGRRRGHARVVASVATDAKGSFRLGVPAEPVYLKVVPTSADWQSGWLWADQITWSPAFAKTVWIEPPDTFDVTPPADLGMIQSLPAFATGRVVDAATTAPGAHARVTYLPVKKQQKTCRSLTDAAGLYRLHGLDYEEYHITVAAAHYIGGYVGGDHNQVFQTEGEAHTWGPGPLDGDVITMVHR